MPRINFGDVQAGYDIVIVGVGPGGCSAAHYIPSNYSVLLIDEVSLPRNKACGGVLVEASIDFLKSLKIPDYIFEVPKELHTDYVDLNNKVVKHQEKGFYNVNRERFDYWLLSLAEDRHNVKIVEKTKLIDFYFTKDKEYVVLILRSNSDLKVIVTKYLLSAEGALSTTRNKLTSHKVPYYIAIQQFMSNKKMQHMVFLYDNEITDFYSWIIPKGKKVLVGSALKPEKARQRFNLLKEKLSKSHNFSENGTISSALISRPSSPSHFFLGKGNILVIGESAGLISPSSGEGISFALRSGKFAAMAIEKNPSKALREYKEFCKPLIERIKQKFVKSRKISHHTRRKHLFEK